MVTLSTNIKLIDSAGEEEIEAKIAKAEDITEDPESSDKFRLIIPLDGGETVSVEGSRSEFIDILNFLEGGGDNSSNKQYGDSW